MKIAIYGKPFPNELHDRVQDLFDKIEGRGFGIEVYEDFARHLIGENYLRSDYATFTHKNLSIGEFSCLISIGGDGTLLDTVPLIGDSGVPVVGINAGRLGFISSITFDEIDEILDNLRSGDNIVEERTLLTADTERNIFGKSNYALNELTIHKKDTTSMVKVDIHIDNEFLNSYWADGVIISTPTGSTAYSLSCGGPIVTPGSENFVITPIAPHNLTVRPVVVSNNVSVSLRADGRSENFLAALDSRSEIIYPNENIIVTRAPFRFRMLLVKGHTFITTMRNKLMWGLDKRN